MQLAQEVSLETLKEYQGGTVTLANNNGSSQLVRGTLKGIRVFGDYAEITMTCEQSAAGDLDSQNDAVWRPSGGNRAPVLLMMPAEIDSAGRLVFSSRTPQGSTAVITRP